MLMLLKQKYLANVIDSAMKVSIIITCYNREKYISRSIRSALNQDFNSNDLEVIVVDDGSTDSSIDIISDYLPEVKLIKIKINQGLPNARNIGIRKAKGRFVLMLDSDDYLDQNIVRVEYLFMSMNPSWSALSCDYLIIDDNENHIMRCCGSSEPIACGIMFKKDALIDIGLYNEKILLAEEVDLRLRFLEKYNIEHIKLPLYRYRKHENNLTKDKNLYDEAKKKVKNKFAK
jgi:glycosyltransferase involved in cell wall biosynthesis